MLIKRRDNLHIPSSEITSEDSFLNRRSLLKAAGILGALKAFPSFGVEERQIYTADADIVGPPWLEHKLNSVRKGLYSSNERPTPYEYVSGYNNFYEFGTDKTDPAKNSGEFVTEPWSVEVSGLAEKTGTYHLEDLIVPQQLEERVYRLRCVEAWSMVVPWIGFPLNKLLRRLEPRSEAKFVRFETLYDPDQMPGQRAFFSSIDYPYVEGLRIDEAMNDLSFLAVGVYGKALPNQNGAPLRLVVPWKYGFKSIKSIVKIDFLSRQPSSTWEKAAPREYGFYANVNPKVDHPRWSQATERRLPGSLFSNNRIDTVMFNGYGPQVAHLYAGMNLKKYY